VSSVIMVNADCDRCGKHADELRPFVLSPTINYRNTVINKAWLCIKCFVIEKEKWWKNPAE
jgi:hypothetical protein